MKKLILFAGAAALLAAGPAIAKPEGQGQGKHSTMKHSNAKKGVKTAQKGAKATRGVVTSDRYGRLYALNARGTCPPGLAKRNNGCLPPGQAKKTYNVGQRYNRNFGSVWTYDQIPDHLMGQNTFDRADRYYYRNGYLYQVDPKTMLVQQAISALLR